MNKKNFILILFLFFLILPIISYAQPIDFKAVINRVTDLLWTIFAGLVVVMFIIVGFLYLTSRGEPGKIQTANKALIWTIIGIAVGILAYSAYNIIYGIIYGSGTWI